MEMAEDLVELLRRLEPMKPDVGGNPVNNRTKDLQVITAEVLVAAIHRLDKIDKSSTEMAKILNETAEANKEAAEASERVGTISVDLGKTNIKLQWWMIILTALTLITSATAIVLALRSQPKPQPTVNNYIQNKTILVPCTTDKKQVTSKIGLCSALATQ